MGRMLASACTCDSSDSQVSGHTVYRPWTEMLHCDICHQTPFIHYPQPSHIPVIGSDSGGKSEHTADNLSLCEAPVIITDGPPSAVVKDLDCSLILCYFSADDQSDGVDVVLSFRTGCVGRG